MRLTIADSETILEMKKQIIGLQDQINMLQRDLKMAKEPDTDVNFRRRCLLKSMKNQREISFIHAEKRNGTYKYYECDTSNLSHLRYIAMMCITDIVYREDVFCRSRLTIKDKITQTTDDEFRAIVDCADEIVKVVAKHKRNYMEKIGKTEIVDAMYREAS